MQWIKLPLIACFLLVLVGVFRHRQRVELRAGSRIAVIGLVALAVISIADPNIPQAVAQRLGVSRGTDLILYLLVVVFALTTMGLYFRLRDADRRLVELARAVAIGQAVQVDGPPGSAGGSAAVAAAHGGPVAEPDATPERASHESGSATGAR